MEEKGIRLKWKIKNFKNHDEIIKVYEWIPFTKSRNKYRYNYGEYYCQFIWVRDILEKEKVYPLYERLNREILSLFSDEHSISLEKAAISHEMTTIFTNINELLCIIVSELYSDIHNVYKTMKNNEPKKKTIKNKLIQKLGLSDSDISDIPEDLMLKQLQAYCDNFVNRLNYIFDIFTRLDKEINLFKELFDIINEYITKENFSKILKEYSMIAIGEQSKEKERCVSLYKFYHRQHNHEGIVSFSGYLETSDQTILDFRNQKIRTDFIKILNEIAASLNTKLVTINTNVKVYEYNYISQNFKISDTLGNMIAKNFNYKDIYSCCERKIFSELNYNIDENDTLYIKLQPCPFCTLGILYEHQEGRRFNIKYGIKHPF